MPKAIEEWNIITHLPSTQQLPTVEPCEWALPVGFHLFSAIVLANAPIVVKMNMISPTIPQSSPHKVHKPSRIQLANSAWIPRLHSNISKNSDQNGSYIMPATRITESQRRLPTALERATYNVTTVTPKPACPLSAGSFCLGSRN